MSNVKLADVKKLPTHPFFALSIILLIAFVASYFIPSSEYARHVVNGRTIVDPDSYQYLPKIYPKIQDFFLSFYQGFGKAWSLIAMVLFVGGAFGVVKHTGLLETTVKILARKFQHAGIAPLALMIMLLFASIIAFTGMWELSMVIVPFVIPLCLSLRYDAIVGLGIVAVAACAAFGTSLTNPFFTAIAHQIAELPIYSAIWYRALSMVIFLTVGFVYLMLYAKRVKASPEKSIMYGEESKYEGVKDDGAKFTPELIRAGIAFVLVFAFLVYGTVAKGFAFAEMSATFVAMGLLVGLAYGAKLNKIWHMFSDGMKDLMLAGLVIFFARAILYVLELTMTIDTIIHFLSQFFIGANPVISAGLVYVVQTFINFIIPSGSGQAAVTIPILVPLADMGEINRQVVCYASQLGDGFSNFIYPTNGSFVALLAIAGVPYLKWFRFFAPLFGIFFLMGIIMSMIAQVINLGPF